MCQLFCANTGNKEVNKLLTYNMAYFGSSVHKHGFGILYNKKFWKTAFGASQLLGLGISINNIVSGKSPVLSHIRLASRGVEIKKELSHPFETENFILFHNGTLFYKDKEKEESREYVVSYVNEYRVQVNTAYKKSDSLCFVEELEKIYTSEKKEFVESLKETMKLFYGTFAFLVLEKKTNKLYVVRGKTKQLFMSFVYDSDDALERDLSEELLGFVIATERETLGEGIHQTNNALGLQGKKHLSFSKPQLLREETIFQIDDKSLVILDEIPENAPPAKPVAKSNFVSKANGAIENTPMIRLCKFMVNNSLTPEDMDLLFFLSMGKFLVEMNNATAKTFLDEVAPKLSANKTLRKRVKKLGFIHRHIYKKYNLEFPWGVESIEKLKETIDILEKENVSY